jgi:hypothetical protein
MSSSGSEIAVLHLVWAPLGPQVLEDFVGAYRRWQPGADHRLVVILNGFGTPADRRLAPVERILKGLRHERLQTPEAVRDLTAYRLSAEQIDAQLLCFLNSYSRPLADGWLTSLARQHAQPSVGLTGSAGSYESAFTAAPFFLRRRRRRDFLPFPNPHLRTNGFMLARELFLDLEWPPLHSKPAAWAVEGGKQSMSRQVWARGLEVLVVGRDGVAYPPERWRESATYRSGDQRNLLIADNRTRQYEKAPAVRRRQLEKMAWGGSAEGVPSLDANTISRLVRP